MKAGHFFYSHPDHVLALREPLPRGLFRSPTKEKPMPAKHASPKKLRVPIEWYVSSFMMDRALDAVVRQIVKLDRRHDIPYLAGYSRDGKTIYIDRHMPK